MLVISSYIPVGLTSRVHHHSGVEAFYVVDGEQCLETPSSAYPMKKGDVLVLPTGITMQMVVTGAMPRRALAAVIYDAAQPPTTPTEDAPPLVTCKISQFQTNRAAVQDDAVNRDLRSPLNTLLFLS